MRPPKAVLLDVLGTLLRLDSPAERLRAELARAGFEVSEEQAADAFRGEAAYYVGHHLEGRDAASLDRLRDRSAEALARALPVAIAGPAAKRALLAALRFSAFPDAAPALGELRAAGVRLVAVSNWDCSLTERLAEAGLADLLDAAVASASVGAAKPSEKIFHAALEAASCDSSNALHVGDSLENDVAGARSAGIQAVLLARGNPRPPVDNAASDVPILHSLAELPALALSRR